MLAGKVKLPLQGFDFGSGGGEIGFEPVYFVASLDCPLRLDVKLSSPVLKCKKTPRKKCSFVAEVKEKR